MGVFQTIDEFLEFVFHVLPATAPYQLPEAPPPPESPPPKPPNPPPPPPEPKPPPPQPESLRSDPNRLPRSMPARKPPPPPPRSKKNSTKIPMIMTGSGNPCERGGTWRTRGRSPGPGLTPFARATLAPICAAHEIIAWP